MRPIQRDDLEFLRTWRNEQQDVLRQQHPLTAEQQGAWFDTDVEPSYQTDEPGQLLVMVEHGLERVAYGGFTHIDWVSRRAELSFLAATEIAGSEEAHTAEFTMFLRWFITVAFGELHLHRLFAETWAFRTSIVAVIEEAGFIREGRMRDHVSKGGRYHDAYIHGLLRSDWQKHG